MVKKKEKTEVSASVEKLFTCTHEGCSKSYSRADHLRRHALTHSAHRPFPCTYQGCTLAFYTKPHLKRHLELHERDKPYSCTWEGCKEAFAKKYQLRKHMCVHTNEAPYPCTQCSRGFIYPSALRYHLASVHGGEKKYVCGYDQCEERFARQRELREHIKSCHPLLKEQPVECQVCGRMLKRREFLRRHMLTHQVDRPSFPCTMEGCTKSFSTPANLAFHIRYTHPPPGQEREKFACPYEGCDKAYLAISRYKQHLLTHDKEGNLETRIRHRESSTFPTKRKRPATHSEEEEEDVDDEELEEEEEIEFYDESEDEVDEDDEEEEEEEEVERVPKKAKTTYQYSNKRYRPNFVETVLGMIKEPSILTLAKTTADTSAASSAVRISEETMAMQSTTQEV